MDKALAKSLIALLSAVLIVIFIYGYASIKNNPSSNLAIYNSWIKADATVVGSDAIMNKIWLDIEFTDSIGTTYKTKVETSESVNHGEKTIEIRYNPDNPKDVFIETDKK